MLCKVVVILRCLWVERNDRIFKDIFCILPLLCDENGFLPFLYGLANNYSRGVPLSCMQCH